MHVLVFINYCVRLFSNDAVDSDRILSIAAGNLTDVNYDSKYSAKSLTN